PKTVVKVILKIYESDIDEDKDIKSIEALFENISDIIMTNTIIPVQRDSSLINNLNSIIFRYYKDLFMNVIPRMKIIIDNYSRFILNEGRYISILIEIIEKLLIEIK